MKHVFKVTIEADEDMDLDDPESVKDLLEEAIRDTGIDNSANIEVEIIPSK